MLYQQLTGLLETHRSSDCNWTELKRGHWDTVLESTEAAVFLASGMCSSECTCTACQPWCPGLRVAPTHPPAWQWHLWDGLLSFYKRWQQGQSLRGKKTTKKQKQTNLWKKNLWEEKSECRGFGKITARCWWEFPDHGLQTNAGNVSKLLFIWQHVRAQRVHNRLDLVLFYFAHEWSQTMTQISNILTTA